MGAAASVSPAHLELIRKAAVANDLGEYAEQLQQLARPSVILATSIRDESQIPIGATRIGGWPDVPESFAWPFWERIPLTFLGQINLAEMTPFQLGLPEKGLLSFFFCFEGGMESTRERFDGAGGVLFFQEDSLSRAKPPKRAPEQFESCAVRCISYPSLPPAYNDRLHDFWGLEFITDDEHSGAYAAVVDQIDETLGISGLSTSGGYNYHQFLGHPHPVQFTPIEIDMERARSAPPGPSFGVELRQSMWEGFKNFILSRKPNPYAVAPERPRPPDDLDRCRQWQLLMMFREDEYAGIRLIDSGCLYFMYPGGEFRNGEFSNPWTAVDYG